MKMLLVPCLALLIMACGGESGGTTLHLAGQDISKDAYRSYLRDQKVKDPAGFTTLCTMIHGVDTAEAARVLKNLSAGTKPIVWTGATPKPGQADDTSDYQTATGILQDECAR